MLGLLLIFILSLDRPASASLPQNAFFRYPVVPGAPISGYLDHNPTPQRVTFYDGRANTSTAYGYIFSCPEKNISDFIGCEFAASGEAACPNHQELSYMDILAPTLNTRQIGMNRMTPVTCRGLLGSHIRFMRRHRV
jgi:hypothetical protein